MQEKSSPVWISVTHYLKTAALLPQQRDELIARAMQQFLSCIPAAGTALIWPGRTGTIPWKIFYVGTKPTSMHRWLSARLHSSTEDVLTILQHDLTSKLPDMPLPIFFPLHSSSSASRALWVIWSTLPLPLSADVLEWLERVRTTLDALLEVENREEHYFSDNSLLYDRELVEALAHGDAHALSAFLSLTRVVAHADFTFWAKAHQDIVEITSHLGAKHGGFGFALARGHGVGGRVLAYGTPIVGDYLNSPYRDSSVSDIVDSEQVRTGIALPVRYNTMPDSSAHVAAVLYATRRTVTPFSLAERLLMQRLARLLEPLPLEAPTSSFFFPGVQQPSAEKAAWYDIVLHATRVEMVEAWAGHLIKGEVIVTGSDDQPYVFSHREQLERIRAARRNNSDAAHVLSLAAPGIQFPGQVYLCSSAPLPPPQWPDFFADLVLACNIVIARMEQAQEQLGRQREQWLQSLLKGKSPQYIEQDGYRLGLRVEQGQLWVIAWPKEFFQSARTARKRIVAESVILDSLKSPLIFLDDDIAIVLLEEQTTQKPSKVRDSLLKHCDPHPLWIVHGARYHSLSELKMTLTHSISIARKARCEEHTHYLLDIYAFGLDSLLENPRLTEDLNAFARKMLTPLLEYDATTSSHLTETFVLAQTLGSAQSVAAHLSVHVNTVRYRLHRAEDILGIEQTSPKEHTAMALAAFTWQRFQNKE